MGATRASTASSVPWFSRLTLGLSKTQAQLVRQIESLFVGEHERASREALLDSMLEILVRADVGIRTSEMLIEKVRTSLPGSELTNPAAVMEVLRSEILTLLRNPTIQASAPQTNAEISSWSLIDSTPLAGQESRRSRVVLMVGVNGVGKTTTTGKLAFKERQAGHSVIVGAADTFRAAAVDQLEEWARRAGADCVRLSDGADPASVAFECVKRAVQQGTDLCLIDTAGRLHNRNDLMQELAKIRRVASKDLPGAPHEVLLVLDATTGQNAIQQARAFKEIAGVTGLVLTKLDGTAKGGVAIALANEMNLPIRYIGVGESVEDLQLFNAEEFVEALFQAPVRSTKETAPALELTQA
ncbi:signal recognition particle-docking protein FtsY [bacterium]|nr:signal recognition particle-docking protein FtsY [bacterium]